MKRIGVAVSLLFATVGVGAAAPPPAEPAPAPARAEGDYGGVRPGAAPPAESATVRRAKPAKQLLTWIGFTPASDGSSELFFQAGSAFSAQQRMEGAALVVLLDGLRHQTPNTQRPLDTRYFNTAIARISARPTRAVRGGKGRPARPAGIEVRIEFRDPRDAKEAAARSETGADGLSYVYLSFGPSSAPQTPPTAAPASEPE